MSNDRQLVAKSCEGCLDSFGELTLRYQGRLQAAMYHLLGNAEDARDVVQEAFLQAFQCVNQFEGRSDFFTWLYRIGVNAALGLRRKRRPALSLDTADDSRNMAWADDSPQSEPMHALVCAEEMARIRQTLARLPAGDRKILLLKEIEGLRYEDIASVLGVPVGTIRSRLHRARMKLRTLLESYERNGD